MRYLIQNLIFGALAAGLLLMPTLAEAAHLAKRRVTQPQAGPAAQRWSADPAAGNAAAGGNNANSMSGSNSAAENANGRSSGGFGG